MFNCNWWPNIIFTAVLFGFNKYV